MDSIKSPNSNPEQADTCIPTKMDEDECSLDSEIRTETTDQSTTAEYHCINQETSSDGMYTNDQDVSQSGVCIPTKMDEDECSIDSEIRTETTNQSTTAEYHCVNQEITPDGLKRKIKHEITHENSKKQKLLTGNKSEVLCLNVEEQNVDETDESNLCDPNFEIASENKQKPEYSINMSLSHTVGDDLVPKREESPLVVHSDGLAVSGRPRFTCDVCRKIFYDRNLLEKHFENHQEKCAEICGPNPADSKQ